jgi:lipoprotein NlpD
LRGIAAFILLLSLGACASKPPAPVEDLSGRVGNGGAPDGFHRVSSGDTLYAIAFRNGLDYRRLAEWNRLAPPYTIFPGELVRLTAPPVHGNRSQAAPRELSQATKPATTSTASSAATAKPPSAKPPAQTQAVGAAPVKPKSAATTPRNITPERWLWPVEGRVIRGFSPTDPSRDGVDIAGREGDPVRASATGTVVYSGNGLIGYGELIIVKHDERWLSAYGHNRKRLVAEGDRVAAGQQIAEVGRNDRNEQVVHFEIRSNGRPVNPLDHLPSR